MRELVDIASGDVYRIAGIPGSGEADCCLIVFDTTNVGGLKCKIVFDHDARETLVTIGACDFAACVVAGWYVKIEPNDMLDPAVMARKVREARAEIKASL